MIKNPIEMITNFNARFAAIHGFSLFGKDPLFVIDNEDNVKVHELDKFLLKNKSKTF